MSLHGRLAAALARPPAAPLMAGDAHRRGPDYRAAAVLAAVTDRAEPGLLLTLRQPHLRAHAGQVSLPGGRLDAADADATAAALREAWEEVALPPAAVAVAGTLPPYETGSGFRITTVVGVVAPDLPLRANADEVADWWELPLAHLLDPANHGRGTRDLDGVTHRFFELVHGERRVWGITAALLVNLSRQLGPAW